MKRKSLCLAACIAPTALLLFALLPLAGCVPPTGGSSGGGSTTPPAPTYEVAAWVPWNHLSSVKTSLTREMKTIDVAHLFWYTLEADGSLKGRTYVDPQLVATLKQNGVKVIPTVTDGFKSGRARAIFADPNKRAQHILDIVDLVDKKGYHGIDLDYESIGSTGRDPFSSFVEDLAVELHRKNKLLSITVYPKTSSPGRWSTGKSHDYGRIGAAADRVNIMSYGYGSSGGSPNPIGPVHYLEKIYAFATTKIPAKKIFLGVPFYGRDWPQGGKGKALTHTSVKTRLATYNPTVTYDPDDGESTFTYTKSGTKHTVWFPSPEGMADKMKVVKRHGLGGIAIWRLGSEDPKLWDSIRKELKPGTTN